MAISKEQLSSIINGRAKQLCNPAGDKLIEGYRRSNNGNINNPNPSDYDNDADAFDRMYLSSLEETENNGMQYSDFSASNSKLPENIKRSMMEHRIDTSKLGQTSVLDSLGIKPLNTPKREKQIVKEQISQPQYNTQTIDYSIIKAIVNECLREHFEKQSLNESTSLQTIGLSNGTISLVDNKGNVFKAKLEKIGNTNDKK
jgi:hypothetical protein